MLGITKYIIKYIEGVIRLIIDSKKYIMNIVTSITLSWLLFLILYIIPLNRNNIMPIPPITPFKANESRIVECKPYI